MSAIMSADQKYRYRLTRGEGESAVCFVMLNPSTADAVADDPTIRRCLGYARAEPCQIPRRDRRTAWKRMTRRMG